MWVIPMIKVNNKRMVYHVADTSFRAEKMRNLFAVIAVILTTILFSALFMIISSLASSMEESTMRQVGGNAHGGFKHLTMDQYETLKKYPYIKEISYSVVLGTAENEELKKRPTEIRYVNDALEAKMMFAMPTTGRLPEAPDEIAADTLVLEKLGVPAKLGEQVTLKYSVQGDSYTATFTLTGFWKGDIMMPASEAWLSKDYVEGILQNYDLNKEDIIGFINADFNFVNSWNIESKIRKVIRDSGYDVDEISYGVNWAYIGGSSIDSTTMIGVVAILLIFLFCGYLMISNVFLISVAKDVRFYGLLKTIGTTGKQIRTMIRRQAMFICLIGIPIGLLFGCLIGGLLTPYILKTLNTNVIKVSFHFWIIIFAVLFSVLTVLVSIRKASKQAAKVSPVEALRTSDVSVTRKRNHKRSGKIRLWKMAINNVGRNRKKAVMVILSLSLSLMILNMAYSLANSFDMEKYLSTMLIHDFVVGDVSWFNVYLNYDDQDTLNDDFLKKLSGQKGIESLERVYFFERPGQLDNNWDTMAERADEELGLSGEWFTNMQTAISDGTGLYHVYGIDDASWEDFTVFEGKIDLEKLRSGNYVVVSPFDTEGKLSAYHVGDSVQVFDANGGSRSCEVLAVADIPYSISIQHSHPVEINEYLPSDVFLEKVEKKSPMIVTLDVSDSQIGAMEQFLADYCKTQDPNMQYSSRATYAAQFESTQRTYKMVGMIISALLALIGIANFVNTNITSIVTRRRELAMLQSIGMTVRQQKIMLMLEGVVYTVFTAMFTWTVGIGIGNFIFMLNGNSYFTMKFTIIPSVICMPVLFFICILVPALCQKWVNQKSIVERMREEE